MSMVDIMPAPGQSQSRPKGFRRISLQIGKAKHLLTPPSSSSSTPSISRTNSSNSACVSHLPSLGTLEQRYGIPGKQLGDGATSSVRVYTHPVDGTVVAVKKYAKSAKPTDDEKRVASEFAIAHPLKHSNVINVLEMGKDNGSWYQVLEYAPIELFEVAESRVMSKEEIYCAWGQVLQGAAYLHKMGIAHRDLKPENVVMTEEGIMKIIDFGSAIAFRQLSSCSSIVMARGFVGCEPYMAPEIFENHPYDPRCVDAWSLGIMFCKLILNRYPWESAETSDPMFYAFSRPTQSITSGDEYSKACHTGPASLLKDLPPESRLTIKGMLQISPGRRLTLRQILQTPFVKQLNLCSQDEDGTVHHAKDHEHGTAADCLAPVICRRDTGQV